jgi:hypothetical protein
MYDTSNEIIKLLYMLEISFMLRQGLQSSRIKGNTLDSPRYSAYLSRTLGYGEGCDVHGF